MSNVNQKGYYKLVKEPLCDCLLHSEMKGTRAWWFLPDIQRSFVWQAKSSLMLLDSILRGWPFGALTIQRASSRDCVSIAPRPFLKESGCVCAPWRGGTYGYKALLERDPDVEQDEFYLVLDGQQRMQSMIFAFADENTGFKQDEWEWMQDLWGNNPVRKIRNRAYKECPLAGIYLDMNKLVIAMADAKRIDEIRYFDDGIICFAIPDKDFDTEYYYRDPEWPFPVRKKDSGLVKLSRVWKFLRAEFNGRSVDDITTSDVLAKLHEYWKSPGWNLKAEILELNGEDVARFVLYLYTNVYKMEIGRIELERPEGVSEEMFQHDVVEIFTRLNHGGEPLKISEITGAWLKNYWDKKAEKKGADKVIEDLKKSCHDKGIELPDFMRFASALWAIAGDAGRERKVIQNKDLTNVGLLRGLALWLSRNWNNIQSATLSVAQDLSTSKWLLDSMGSVAFPLAVLVAFRMKIDTTSAMLDVKSRAKYQYETLGKIRCESIRFLACSNWSDYWNIASLTTFGKKLESADVHNATAFMKVFCDLLEEVLVPRAESALSEVEAIGRSQVRAYYSYLQIWHRLNKLRYETWSPNLDSSDLHVDHCLAYAKWLEILGESKSRLTVEKDQEYRKMINSIGNCMLLRSEMNIGRGKKPFREFFEYLWDNENIEARSSLGITDEIAMPTKDVIENVRRDIRQRETDIKCELKEFIHGRKFIEI